jgi:hypothetical protein
MAIKNKETYKGTMIKQVRGIVQVFDSFFEKEKFDHIVEIGTGNGAFSIYFASKAHEMGADFITYDIKRVSNKIRKEITAHGGKVVTCDINEDTTIASLIESPGRCLLLNDGGLKVPEFHRFAKIMKKNDIMMTHDYYKNRKETSSGTVVMSEIVDSISKNKLKVINENMFDSCLWLCVIKD